MKSSNWLKSNVIKLLLRRKVQNKSGSLLLSYYVETGNNILFVIVIQKAVAVG